jgi:Protein of unknown function (DUF2637)
MSWAVAVCIDLTCVIAARERQRDQRLGITTRQLSWPAIVLAGGVALSLAANLAQAHPDAWGRIVAAVPSVAFLVAVSMIERRAARRPQRPAAVPGQDGGASDLVLGPGRPSPARTKRTKRSSRQPAAPPPSTRTSTGSPSPATRSAPASACPPRPPPTCCATSAPARKACHPESPASNPHDAGSKATSPRPASDPRAGPRRTAPGRTGRGRRGPSPRRGRPGRRSSRQRAAPVATLTTASQSSATPSTPLCQGPRTGLTRDPRHPARGLPQTGMHLAWRATGGLGWLASRL